MGLMERSWKVVESIRDKREKDASEAAQDLARAILEVREVALATAILQGGAYATRRALELAELIIDSERRAGSVPKVASTR
jgi:hypothetical protein